MSVGNKKDFVNLFNKKKFKTIGEFQNGRSPNGKQFVIYKKPDSLFYFITGHDFNWEVDWRISEQGMVFKSYHLTGDQKKKVIEILTKT